MHAAARVLIYELEGLNRVLIERCSAMQLAADAVNYFSQLADLLAINLLMFLSSLPR